MLMTDQPEVCLHLTLDFLEHHGRAASADAA
jgi:hypothetical protein